MTSTEQRREARAAAKAFRAMEPDERRRYERAVEEMRAAELQAHEYAEISGLDRKLLWRMAATLPLPPVGG